VLTPDTDPFYQPPAGFESTQPGTILRNRTVIASFLGLIPAANVETYQLLYRTTAINGSAIAGVTTVFKPVNATTDRFVSFQTAYDGSATICDPSYNYQFLSAQVDLISDVEFLLLEAFLLSGYVVSSPDYEGPDAAFSAGRLSGMGVLDSMRAVTSFHDTLGFTTDQPNIVGYGYSGGAIATGWAASLQSEYAKELPVQGWASGGTPANLTGTALFIDGTAFSGFLPAAIDGLMKPSAYGQQLQPKIQSIITPYGQSKLDFAEENCIADLFNFFGQSVLSTKFQTEGSGLYYDPIVKSVMQQQTIGVERSETPIAPVYIYHAQQDEIIPYANATTLVNSWCTDGADVQFVTFANGGHFTTEILGFVGAFDFVQSAFAGELASGCSRSTSLSNTLSPIALGADLEPVLVQLINTLLTLGPGDSNVIGNLGVLNGTIVT
jgi:pimeloyl-ACP methyl ester carboxylesterase